MKNFILIVVFLCVITKTKAQTIIEYDFCSGTFTKGLEKVTPPNLDKKFTRLENNSLITVVVKNINTFRYEVTLKGSNIDYVTQMPSELQTIFRQTDPPKNTISNSASEIAEKTALMEQQEQKIRALNLTAKSGNKQIPMQNAMNRLVEACQNYLTAAKKLAEMEVYRIYLINTSKQNLCKPPSGINTYSRATMQNIYTDFVDTYTKAIANYQEVKNIAESPAVKDLLLSDDVINDAYEKIEKANATITATDVLKLIDDIDKLQIGLQDAKNYSVISAPIQVLGDYLLIEGNIKPSPVGDLMPYESVKTFPIEIPVKGGTKVDFSVGPTISMGHNAKDEKYFLEESTTAGKSYLRQRDNNNAGTPGLAAMMHVYRRNGKETAFGGLFGVGAGFQTIEDVDLSFYLGGSVIMGKKQKVMINGGLSFLRVNRLKNKEFVVGKEYTTQDLAVSNC